MGKNIRSFKRKKFFALGISTVMLILSLETAFAQTPRDKMILLKTENKSTLKFPFLNTSESTDSKTFVEENDLEFVEKKNKFKETGFLSSKDEETGKLIKVKGITPISSEAILELGDITATEPDSEGFIEVTVPYILTTSNEVAVSTSVSSAWTIYDFYHIPDFIDSYTGNMIAGYHWWDYRPDEVYDPGITNIEWGNKSYTIYDYEDKIDDNWYKRHGWKNEANAYITYTETGLKNDGLHYVGGRKLYFSHIFRIPKDYDGLTLVFIKDYPKDLAKAVSGGSTDQIIYDVSGYKLSDSELYHGYEPTLNNFYYIRISDYIND